MVMTPDQVKYHLDAWAFTFALREQSVEQWNFDTIRADLDKLEAQRGAAYPTP